MNARLFCFFKIKSYTVNVLIVHKKTHENVPISVEDLVAERASQEKHMQINKTLIKWECYHNFIPLCVDSYS